MTTVARAVRERMCEVLLERAVNEPQPFGDALLEAAAYIESGRPVICDGAICSAAMLVAQDVFKRSDRYYMVADVIEGRA